MGDSDGIAPWRMMQQRLEAIAGLGIDTEFHVHPELSHGFGLGAVAEEWITTPWPSGKGSRAKEKRSHEQLYL